MLSIVNMYCILRLNVCVKLNAEQLWWIMPNLRIETNVAEADIVDVTALLADLSKALAATTGKPEQYMMVQVRRCSRGGPDYCMHCGGVQA